MTQAAAVPEAAAATTVLRRGQGPPGLAPPTQGSSGQPPAAQVPAGGAGSAGADAAGMGVAGVEAAGMGVAGIGAVASTGGSATAGDVSCTDLPQDMQNFASSVNCAPQYMQYLIMHSISPLRSDTTITARTGCGRRTNDAGTWGYRIKRTSRPGPNGTKVAAVQRHCTTRTRSSSRRLAAGHAELRAFGQLRSTIHAVSHHALHLSAEIRYHHYSTHRLRSSHK